MSNFFFFFLADFISEAFLTFFSTQLVYSVRDEKTLFLFVGPVAGFFMKHGMNQWEAILSVLINCLQHKH